MSALANVSSGDSTSLNTEDEMNTLLVFIDSKNYNSDNFLTEQYEKDDVMEVQVMSSKEGKVFMFGLITYKNEKAAIMGMKSFSSIDIFTQRVTLNKIDNTTTIMEQDEAMDLPSPTSEDIDFFNYRVAEEPKVVLDKNCELQCIDIFEQYQNTKDLDHLIHQLFHDPFISNFHEVFVSSLLIKGLSDGPKVLEEMGTLFGKVIIKRAISVMAINDGINIVLNHWTDHILNFPNFFTHIASVIAPLILTCSLYDIHQLKNAFQSISLKVSSVLIIELSKTIVEYSDQFKDNKNLNGIIWLYNKWTNSEYTSLDNFLPCEQLNNYFKRDRFGVFFLSISIYDEMKTINPTDMYHEMRSWIDDNISKQIIDDPIFVRALTIAVIFINLQHKYSYTHFFNFMTGELLTYYIKSKPFETDEIQLREVQCLYGIQIAVAGIYKPPQDFILNLFTRLHEETIVSSGSFNIWKDENQLNAKFIEDHETKKKTLESFDWNDLIIKLASNNSNE